MPAPLEGRDLSSLLKDPKAIREVPAITTHGFQNHTIRTEGWRYIRYTNGEEELYDETADPFEYTNLASRSEHAARKAELAAWLPKSNSPDLPSGGDAEGEDSKKAKRKAKKAQQ
jgi:hypothetical protein